VAKRSQIDEDNHKHTGNLPDNTMEEPSGLTVAEDEASANVKEPRRLPETMATVKIEQTSCTPTATPQDNAALIPTPIATEMTPANEKRKSYRSHKQTSKK